MAAEVERLNLSPEAEIKVYIWTITPIIKFQWRNHGGGLEVGGTAGQGSPHAFAFILSFLLPFSFLSFSFPPSRKEVLKFS